MSIKKREDSFIGIHFDFHANDDCTEIGRQTTPEMIQYIVDTVKPDFIQCDCKGHRGLSSYPTKAGYPAPGFVKDNLRIWRDVTMKNGVPLYMHYSGVWDTEAIKHHPDWAAVDANGERNPNKTSVFGPYVDELMIPQLKELINEYQIDGIWVDGECWATVRDYGEKALGEFMKETGITEIPKGPEDKYWYEFSQFFREAFKKYLRHYVKEMHDFDPSFQITSNWTYSSQVPGKPDIDLDYVSGDSALVDSYDENRFESRCIAPQGFPWDLMSWAFASMFTEGAPSTKPAVQLKQEAAAVISMGGGWQAYYNQKRDGSISCWQMKAMGEAAEFCRQRKDYCFRAKQVPQVGLLNSSYDFYKKIPNLFGSWTLWDGPMVPTKGLLMNLLDNQFSVEILQEHHLEERIQEYPVVVVPEIRELTSEFKALLLKYAENGGKLLLVGPSSVELFEEQSGVVLKQHLTPEVEKDFYERSNNLIPQSDRKVRTFPDNYRYQNYVEYNGFIGGYRTIGLAAEPKEGTRVIARNFAVNDCTGEDWIPAATVAPYGKGMIGTVLLNIGERYLNGRTFQNREILGGIMRELFDPMVKVKGSHKVDVVLNKKDGKLMVSLINSNMQSNPKEYTFDEIVPVSALDIEIVLPAAPKKVTLQPANRELPHAYENGVLRCRLDSLELYDIIVIE